MDSDQSSPDLFCVEGYLSRAEGQKQEERKFKRKAKVEVDKGIEQEEGMKADHVTVYLERRMELMRDGARHRQPILF